MPAGCHPARGACWLPCCCTCHGPPVRPGRVPVPPPASPFRQPSSARPWAARHQQPCLGPRQRQCLGPPSSSHARHWPVFDQGLWLAWPGRAGPGSVEAATKRGPARPIPPTPPAGPPSARCSYSASNSPASPNNPATPTSITTSAPLPSPFPVPPNHGPCPHGAKAACVCPACVPCLEWRTCRACVPCRGWSWSTPWRMRDSMPWRMSPTRVCGLRPGMPRHEGLQPPWRVCSLIPRIR